MYVNETQLLVDRIMADVRNIAMPERHQPEAVAKAVDKACRDFARAVGMNPECECDFTEPGAQRHIPAANGWTVVFEAGPHDWAIDASMEIIGATGLLCEPYYGFDLTFYREENADEVH